MELPDHEYFQPSVSTSRETSQNKSNKPDFTRLCRICASTNEYLIPIFEGEGLQLDLRPKVEKYLPVTINSTDDLPTSMCYQCASSILSWHDLVQNCVTADKQLRDMKIDPDNESWKCKEEKDGQDTNDVNDDVNDDANCNLTSSKESSSNSRKESNASSSLASAPVVPCSMSNASSNDSTFSTDVDAADMSGGKEVTSEKFIEMLSEAGDDDAHQDGWNSVVVIIDESRPELSLKARKPVKQKIRVLPRKINNSNVREEEEVILEEKLPKKPFFDLGNGEWVCSLCYYFTAIKSRLIDHQTREHYDLIKSDTEFLKEKAKGWFCSPCDLQFSCDDTYRVHMKKQHPVAHKESDAMFEKLSAKYLCDVCEKVYYCKDSFRKHNIAHHLFTKRSVIDCLAKRSRRCELCGGIYDSPESLRDHLKEEHPKNIIDVNSRTVIIRSLVCTVCWVEHQSIENVRDHLKLEHNVDNENAHNFYRLLCRVCAESFDREDALAEHHRKKHARVRQPKMSVDTGRSSQDKSLICDLCGKVFSKRQNMLSHRERHVLPEHWTKYQEKVEECRVIINGEVNFQCHLCPRVQEKAEEFVRHLVLHDRPKSFVCHECGFQTTRERLLRRHINTVHLNQRDFQCDLCPQAFGTKRTLEDHRRRHTGERPWLCKFCDKTFPNATCLYRHKQSHTDYFPFPCEWPGCDNKFRTRGKREAHMRVHTGQKPYACSICPKAFRRLGDLKKHETVHTDLRPCICDVCGRSYKHKKYLAFHRRSAHME